MASESITFWESLQEGDEATVIRELAELALAFHTLSVLFEKGGGTILHFEDDSEEEDMRYYAVEVVSKFLRTNVFRAARISGIDAAGAAFAEDVCRLDTRLAQELQMILSLPVDGISEEMLLTSMKQLLDGIQTGGT